MKGCEKVMKQGFIHEKLPLINMMENEKNDILKR